MDNAPDIRTKPPCRREDAEAVLRRLREAGHVAYFAGGCVRDLLLGLEPKDFDVATDAPPQRVRELFNNTQAVGAAFGVILVRVNKSVVEVATFRSDGDYEDGRRPTRVHFTTAQEDAHRRDFTINGLFFDPLENRVIDYVGGQADLAARRLRAIGRAEERFAEDHLRLLRAIRFAARFGLSIESNTSAAILAAAPLLKRISPERIGDELRLMLTAPSRARAWTLLWEYELVDVVFRMLPEKRVGALDGGRCIFLSLDPNATVSFGLALAAGALCWRRQATPGGADPRTLLARPQVALLVKASRQALKISNDEGDELAGTLEGIAPLLADDAPPLAAKKRFLARPSSRSSRLLLDAICRVGLFADRIASLLGELAALERTDFAPPPLITGDDLTAASLTPGPMFKQVLWEVYDAQLESRVGTKAEAMAMAMEMANTHGRPRPSSPPSA